MILDLLENLSLYATLNPSFPKVIEFIQGHDLNSLPLGKTVIDGDNVYVNVQDTTPHTREDAVIESHNQYIDIQVPLDRMETMGYSSRKTLPEVEYHADGDYSLYPGHADSYFNVLPGMFTVFFPADGHAPGISRASVHKLVFKVKA